MSAFDELVTAIERHTGRQGRSNGKHIRLLCPAHDDHHPSLDIADNEGTPLVFCRSHQCSYEEILAAVGLEPTDLHENTGNGTWTPHGATTAIYPYVDEQGRLLFEVIRKPGKQFPQRRPDGNDGWIWNLNGVRRVLYRLPQVLQAVANGETIYVVEGEKDVATLEQLGLVATCNPGGAGKWSDDYAQVLVGAQIIIVADRDPPGYQHARRVARSLEAGAHITLRQPAINHLGADITDHLAAGYTLDQLAPLEAEDSERFRLTVRTAAEILAIPDPPDDYQLLGPLIFRGARTIIVGDTGHGKTSLALQMLAAVLKGDEMLGQIGAGAGPILAIDLEQGIRSIKRGLRENGLGDRNDVLYVTIPDGLALDRDEEHYAALNDTLAEHRPIALLLDPYYKAHRADDPNAERPIIDLMRKLDALRATYEFALLLPAHPRKDIAGREGARKLTIHDVAGSGAATRGAEIVLGLERLGHGYARLRYLKDRDGDLPIGETTSLLYSKEEGFRLDPRESETDETIETRILETERSWLTIKEWAAELKIRQAQARKILTALAASGRVAYMVGPPGRSPKAQCYATDPKAWEQSGSVDQSLLERTTDPTVPTSYIGGGTWDQSDELAEPGISPPDKETDW